MCQFTYIEPLDGQCMVLYMYVYTPHVLYILYGSIAACTTKVVNQVSHYTIIQTFIYAQHSDIHVHVYLIDVNL